MVEAFLKSLNNAAKGQRFQPDSVTFLIKSFQTSDSKRVFAFFLYPTDLVVNQGSIWKMEELIFRSE
jgi:hypothetical protein